MQGTTFRRNTRSLAAERKDAAAELIAAGLTVVPLTSPWSNGRNPGKAPLRDDELGGRAEVRVIADLSVYLDRVPDLNLAVLGVVQVDCDDAVAVAKAKDLGVTRENRSWFVQTRRGWKALYRPPAEGADELVVRTKAGCTCPEGATPEQVERCSGWHPPTGGKLELDLLIGVPAVVPPSVHRSGHHYRWAPGHSPAEIPLADLDEPPVLVLEFWKNICRPKRTHFRDPLPQGAGFEAAIRGALAFRTKFGQLPGENAAGWINAISCPFPENHRHGDKNPSFGVNFRIGAWKCFSSCGSGSLLQLAERLNLPTPGVRLGRGGRISTTGVPSGAFMTRGDLVQ